MRDLDGAEEIIKRLAKLKGQYVERVAVAVEKTAVDVANHAKADHSKGLAHAAGRYENQTDVLTNSIMPKLTRADEDMVEAEVGTNVDYGPKVEYGTSRARAYPFMHPAMEANRTTLKRRVKDAVNGNA